MDVHSNASTISTETAAFFGPIPLNPLRTSDLTSSNGTSPLETIIFNKLRKPPPFSEYHFRDDAHVRATTFRGKFTNFVKKNVEIEAFENWPRWRHSTSTGVLSSPASVLQ